MPNFSYIIRLHTLQNLQLIDSLFVGIAVMLLLLFVLMIRLAMKKAGLLSQQITNYSRLNKSFLSMIDLNENGIVLFNNGSFYHANEKASLFIEKIIGLSPEEFSQLSVHEVIVRLETRLNRSIQYLLEENFSTELKDIITETDAGPKHFNININSLILDGDLKIDYFYIKETTKSQNIISKLHDNERFIGELMTNARDGFMILKGDFSIVSVNEKGMQLLNFESKPINQNILTLFPELENSIFKVNCEYVIENLLPVEFEYFLASRFSYFNVRCIPKDNQIVLFFIETTPQKISNCINESERMALELFSKGNRSFYQIIAKTIDKIQSDFQTMFISIYHLNADRTEFKYFSSGYSNFLTSSPKTIHNDFLGFNYLMENDVRIERNNLYFDYLNELFDGNNASVVFSTPIREEGQTTGLILFYLQSELLVHPSINALIDNTRQLVEKLFHYRSIFRELEKLSIVSQNSQKAFATINIDEQITWCNESFYKLFNVFRQDVLLKNITVIFNQQTINGKNCEIILESIVNFENYDVLFDYYDHKSEPKQIHLSTRKIHSGDEIQLLLEIEDLTERVNYEKLLLDRQQFLRKITDTVPITLYQCKIDKEYNISFPFISKEVERIIPGMTMADIYQNPTSLFKLIHEDDLSRIMKSLVEVRTSNSSWNEDFRIYTPDGLVKWIRGSAVPEIYDDEALQWFGYFEDVTEKITYTREIEEVNKRFDFVSKAVNEVIWEWNIEGNTMSWGTGIETFFGYSKDDCPTVETLQNYIHPEDFPVYWDKLQHYTDCDNMELFNLNYRFKKFDGSYADVKDRAFIIRDQRGNVNRIIGSIRDITEILQFEKKKQELVYETQEFERNQFSMELHDGLAQQLVALNLFISQLENDLPEDKRSGVELCRKIVLDSLNQTRTLCYNLSPPELSNGLISGLKALFDRLGSLNNIKFDYHYSMNLHNGLFENIDIYNIYRIVQEFVNNSLKHAGADRIKCSIDYLPSRKRIVINLQDNGKGFDIQQVKFGFGIQNMMKRARLANTEIDLKSEINKGTGIIITIEIP